MCAALRHGNGLLSCFLFMGDNEWPILLDQLPWKAWPVTDVSTIIIIERRYESRVLLLLINLPFSMRTWIGCLAGTV